MDQDDSVNSTDNSISTTQNRKNILKGKKINALSDEGLFQITLTIKNLGEVALEGVHIGDVIPENFEYGSFSLEPERTDSIEGKDMLVWQITRIEAKEIIEIIYEITGCGDNFRASGTQFSIF